MLISTRSAASRMHVQLVLLVATTFLASSRAVAAPYTVVAWGNSGESIVPPGLTNVVAIDAGINNTMTLRDDGTVGCWRNHCRTNSNSAQLTDVAAVSMEAFFVLALRSNGLVSAWGDNYFGEATVPAGLTNVIAIDTGDRQSLVLKGDGSVMTWGQDGTYVPPAALSNVIAISASPIENHFHALALKNDGTVVAWGVNGYGESNVPAGLSNVTAIAAGGYHNLALKSDGTVSAWAGKDAAVRTPPAGLSNVVAIAAGHYHSLALKSDGTVVSWKSDLDNCYGAADVPAGLSNVVAISAGRYHSVALTLETAPVISEQPSGLDVRQYGSFSIWIRAAGSQPITYQWQKDGIAISGATNDILWLQSVGFEAAGSYTVVVSNSIGSVTSQPALVTVSPWIEFLSQPQSQVVNAGSNVTFSVIVVGSQPRTLQWMRNDVNVLGATNASLTLSNVQTEAGTYAVVVSSHGLVTISASASLTIIGNALPAIVVPPRSETIWVGAKLVLQVTATGQTPLRYQWRKGGSDLAGQTNTTLAFDSVQSGDAGIYDVIVSNGAGTNTSPPALLSITTRVLNLAPPSTVVSIRGPLLPTGLTDIVAIAAAPRHALALKSNGTVVAWGDEYLPPLGGSSHTPPAGLSNVVGIAAGASIGVGNGHSLALKRDGTVVAWSTIGSPPTVPGGLFGVIAVAAGARHGLALRADGSVVSWGDALAQVPPALRNVIAIAAGGRRSLALRADGSVAAWGDLGAPDLFNSLTGVSAVAAGSAHIMALRADGSIVDYFGGSDPTNSAPVGISTVIAIAAGDTHSLALINDGTVIGSNGALLPEGLMNVTAISAGRGYSLLLTTNPPPPMLAGGKAQNVFALSAPVSVSGYVLESTDSLSQPYTVVSNVAYSVDTENASLLLPLSGEKKFYRLRKLP